MSDIEFQVNDEQAQPIIDPPSGAGSTLDDELDALLRHAEALTEVIACNAEGDPEDYLQSIADQGPVVAKPRPRRPARPVHAAAVAKSAEESPVAGVAEPTSAPSEASSDHAAAELETPAVPEPTEDDVSHDVDAAVATDDETTPPVQITDDQTAEIDEILQEAAEAPAIDAASETSPRHLPDLLTDPDQTPEAAGEAEQAAEPNVEVLYIPDEDAPATPVAEPDIGNQPEPESEAAPVEVERPPEETAEPVESASESESAAAPESMKDSTRPPFIAQFVGLLGKAIGSGRSAIRAIAQTPARIIASVGYVLGVLNAPFDKLSERRRQVIGIVAIATLISAALAWVLPWLLTSNPFAHIPLGIVTKH